MHLEKLEHMHCGYQICQVLSPPSSHEAMKPSADDFFWGGAGVKAWQSCGNSCNGVLHGWHSPRVADWPAASRSASQPGSRVRTALIIDWPWEREYKIKKAPGLEKKGCRRVGDTVFSRADREGWLAVSSGRCLRCQRRCRGVEAVRRQRPEPPTPGGGGITDCKVVEGVP